jgi:argininosuccinate lyase
VGNVGLKLHSGRSRNEQIATNLRLHVREAGERLEEAIDELCTALVERAESAGENAMPAYTHMQRAEPVLVAHWLLAYVAMFSRDAERIAECVSRADECPLGSGAVAGSTIALDRNFLAAELGFARATANSMDATSDRDFAVELVQALALLGTHLSRMAEEFIIYSTQEFGFVILPETYSTGSSAMPQKKNPDALELIRAKSARLIGNSVALLTNVKGLPLAYNKDLQDTQEPLFDGVDTASAILKISAGFIREVAFDFARMQAAASASFMNSFAAATYLVGKGVEFRTAHEQVAKAVRLCIEKQCALEDLSLEELKKFNAAFDRDFYAAVSLRSVLAMHDVAGGTSPERVKASVAAQKKRLSSAKGKTSASA